jgi:pimeloyl-ACP methyl ester carboxylesterase
MSTTSSLLTPEGSRLSLRHSLTGSPGKPLLVLVPGGTYDSGYFDSPGHSMVEAAAAAGFNVVAFDRPNYGGSGTLPAERTTFAENARILADGITQVLAGLPKGPGVVIIGHSIGGAIGMDIAAGNAGEAWPLLGIALSGVCERSPDPVVAVMQSVPAGQMVEMPAEQRRMFMYGPDGTFDPALLARPVNGEAPAPAAELLEIVSGWLDDFPRLLTQVRVPVHYTLAEFDQLWITDQSRVESFVGRLTSSPLVQAERLPGVGHNIDHHYAGATFQAGQLAFAARCADLSPDPVTPGAAAPGAAAEGAAR